MKVMGRARDGSAVETVLRGACTEMGSKAAVTFPPLTRLTCQKYGQLSSSSSLCGKRLIPVTGVAHTVSQAWRMGRAVALCRQQSNIRDVVAGLLELQNGACLFTGKIVDVRRVRVLLTYIGARSNIYCRRCAKALRGAR